MNKSGEKSFMSFRSFGLSPNALKPEQVQTQPMNALYVQTSHGSLLYLHSQLVFSQCRSLI
jgi:hypothetical protein